MSIFRRYEWYYKNRSLWYEINWPQSWLDELRRADHSIRDVKEYSHYVRWDPLSNRLDDFLQGLYDVGINVFGGFEDEKDELHYFLSFVQYLNYYEERGEYPRYPLETVIDQGGDCEDTAILMAYIADRIGYDVALFYFKNEGFFGIGAWGHVDIGIAPNYEGEFSGTYWTKNGVKYYYTHWNGRNYRVGDYSGKWGDMAYIYPL